MGAIQGTHGYSSDEFAGLQSHVQSQFSAVLEAISGPLVSQGQALVWTGNAAVTYAESFSNWLSGMLLSTAAQFTADQQALHAFAVQMATILQSSPPAGVPALAAPGVSFQPEVDTDGRADTVQMAAYAAFIMSTFEGQVRPAIDAVIARVDVAVGSGGTAVRALPAQIDTPKATLVAEMQNTVTHLNTEFQKGSDVVTSYVNSLRAGA